MKAITDCVQQEMSHHQLFSCCAMQGVSNGLVTVWAMVAAPAICASAKLKDLVRQRCCVVLCCNATTFAAGHCGYMAQKCVSHCREEICTDVILTLSTAYLCQLLVLHCCALYALMCCACGPGRQCDDHVPGAGAAARLGLLILLAHRPRLVTLGHW